METRILTNTELHQIEQEIDKISSLADSLNPDVFEDSQKLARYDEILNYYLGLLQVSYKKARISESNLRLAV